MTLRDIQVEVAQVTPVIVGEGDAVSPKATKLGALFTADWRQQLTLAGLIWAAKVGGTTTSADILPVVGGGAGTVIDSAQPELVLGVDAGYYLIVVEAMCSVYNDPNTDNAITNIVLFADRTQAPDTTTPASGVITTPVNLLDGAAAFPGRCYTAVSGDLTAGPICSELLDYESATVGAVTGGAAVQSLKMDYKPEVPSIIAGPCQIALCFGGTVATSGMGVVKVAVVPTSYFPVS